MWEAHIHKLVYMDTQTQTHTNKLNPYMTAMCTGSLERGIYLPVHQNYYQL